MGTINPLAGKSRLAVQNSTAFINVYEGSVRSGKTVATLIDWIRFCRTAPPGSLLMTGKTERTVINNLVLPIQDMLGRSRVSINRGNGTVNICGREVMLIGANNEQARTKIQGLTLLGAYVDEASTLPESYWNMLTTRMSEDGARMWATCNPEGPRHWFKIKWIDKAKLWVKHDGSIVDRNSEFDAEMASEPDAGAQTLIDLHRFSFTLEDNRGNLTDKYYRNVMSMYSGLWYQRMVLGLWSVAEGAIYSMFNPALHVVSDLPQMERLLACGIDFGVQHPTRGVLVGLGVDHRLYVVAVWTPPKGTEAERVASLARFYEEHGTPEYTFADPGGGGAGLILQAHQSGIPNVFNAIKDVVDGIGTVASLLSAGMLLIHESCTDLIDEIPGYVWDVKAAERGEDAPVKANDDNVDAWRYAIFSSRIFWQPYIDLYAATRHPDPHPEVSA